MRIFSFSINDYYLSNVSLKKYVKLKLITNRYMHIPDNYHYKRIRNYKYRNYDRIIERSHEPEIENLFDVSYREEIYMSFFYKINNRYYKSFKMIRGEN